MKKSLLAALLVLGLCSSSMESPVERYTKKATRSTVADALPKGWRIEAIAKAAHPSAIPKDTHVLAWKRIEDDRPFLVEDCLVLCRLPEGSGPDRWLLVNLYRHPKEPSKDWRLSIIHCMGRDGCRPFIHRRSYKNRPSNNEIYGFADGVGWCFGPEKGFKLLGRAVCKTTWETVVKEKPTRDFKK